MNRQVSTLTLVNSGAVPLAEVPVLDFGAFAGELVEEVAREGRWRHTLSPRSRRK